MINMDCDDHIMNLHLIWPTYDKYFSILNELENGKNVRHFSKKFFFRNKKVNRYFSI